MRDVSISKNSGGKGGNLSLKMTSDSTASFFNEILIQSSSSSMLRSEADLLSANDKLRIFAQINISDSLKGRDAAEIR